MELRTDEENEIIWVLHLLRYYWEYSAESQIFILEMQRVDFLIINPYNAFYEIKMNPRTKVDEEEESKRRVGD